MTQRKGDPPDVDHLCGAATFGDFADRPTILPPGDGHGIPHTELLGRRLGHCVGVARSLFSVSPNFGFYSFDFVSQRNNTTWRSET